jgi:regulatory protein
VRQKKSNWEKVLRFLTFRPRSQKEVENYLDRKRVDPVDKLKLLKRLKQLNFLNDEEFAQWLIEQRARLKPKGKRALRQELRQKGIKPEIVEKALQAVNEVVEAKKIVAKKKLAAEKMAALLVRRGFSWETIKTVQPGETDDA